MKISCKAINECSFFNKTKLKIKKNIIECISKVCGLNAENATDSSFPKGF